MISSKLVHHIDSLDTYDKLMNLHEKQIIGCGAQGVVLHIEPYAIKIIQLKTNAKDKQQQLENIDMEITAMQRLSTTGVTPKYVGHVLKNDYVAIVSEFLDGYTDFWSYPHTLDNNDKSAIQNKIINVGKIVANTLEKYYIINHDFQFMIRKNENGEWQVKAIDFGICKECTRERTRQRTGLACSQGNKDSLKRTRQFYMLNQLSTNTNTNTTPKKAAFKRKRQAHQAA